VCAINHQSGNGISSLKFTGGRQTKHLSPFRDRESRTFLQGLR